MDSFEPLFGSCPEWHLAAILAQPILVKHLIGLSAAVAREYEQNGDGVKFAERVLPQKTR